MIKTIGLALAAGCIVLSGCEVLQPGQKTLQEFEQPAPADTVAGDMIKPKTADSAAALKKITVKLDIDRMNAKSNTGDNSQLGLYYSHKAAELQYLINQLESNQPISKQQLSEALDNQGALEYGGYP